VPVLESQSRGGFAGDVSAVPRPPQPERNRGVLQAAHPALAPEAQAHLDAGFTDGSTVATAGLDRDLSPARLRQRLQASTSGWPGIQSATIPPPGPEPAHQQSPAHPGWPEHRPYNSTLDRPLRAAAMAKGGAGSHRIRTARRAG
jgi:hypothetical protein